LLGEGKELAGPEQAVLRVLPAHERLRTGDLAVGDGDLGLVVQHQLGGDGTVGQVVQQHGELVPAEARQRVTAAQHPAQPLGDVAQQRVAVVVPERVVDLLEAVEVDQQQAGEPAERLTPPVTRSTRWYRLARFGSLGVDRHSIGGEEMRMEEPHVRVLDLGQGRIELLPLGRRERPAEIAGRQVGSDRQAIEHAGELLGLAQRPRLDLVLEREADAQREHHHRQQARPGDLPSRETRDLMAS